MDQMCKGKYSISSWTPIYVSHHSTKKNHAPSSHNSPLQESSFVPKVLCRVRAVLCENFRWSWFHPRQSEALDVRTSLTIARVLC